MPCNMKEGFQSVINDRGQRQDMVERYQNEDHCAHGLGPAAQLVWQLVE